MSPRLSPVGLLGLLVLAATAASGWFYGWHWRQVASGGKPTQEEKLIIQLQDKLDAARAENERLTGLLRVKEEAADPDPEPPADPGLLQGE